MAPLQSFQIPIEIYIIFIEQEDGLFCALDIEKEMNERFNLGISKQSVHKTLKGLTETERLIMESREKPGLKVKANYYRINPAKALPVKNIIKRQYIQREIINTIPIIEFEPSKNGQPVTEDEPAERKE